MATLNIENISSHLTPMEQNIVPDYGATQPLVPAPADGPLATELPITRDFLAGGIAEFDRLGLTEAGFEVLYKSAPIIKSVNKLSQRAQQYELKAAGEDSEYKEWLQENINQAEDLQAMVDWMTWANYDGARFCQMFRKSAPDGITPMIVPSFHGGGRIKSSAGGTIAWDGVRLVEIQQFSFVGGRTEPKELPIREFVIHRPGAGSNPEGDLYAALAMITLAEDYDDSRLNLRNYIKLYGTPAKLIKKDLANARPTEVDMILQRGKEVAKKIVAGSTASFNKADIIELLEPKGHGVDDLLSALRYYEGVADQFILLNLLTSDTRESGAAGSSQVHKTEEDIAVVVNLKRIAASMNRHVIPWINFWNPMRPELGDAPMPYLEFTLRETQKDEVDEMGKEAIDPLADPDLNPFLPKQVPPAQDEVAEAQRLRLERTLERFLAGT